MYEDCRSVGSLKTLSTMLIFLYSSKILFMDNAHKNVCYYLVINIAR